MMKFSLKLAVEQKEISMDNWKNLFVKQIPWYDHDSSMYQCKIKDIQQQFINLAYQYWLKLLKIINLKIADLMESF